MYLYIVIAASIFYFIYFGHKNSKENADNEKILVKMREEKEKEELKMKSSIENIKLNLDIIVSKLNK